MSQNEATASTQHAMLAIWGQFAHCLGPVEKLEADASCSRVMGWPGIRG